MTQKRRYCYSRWLLYSLVLGSYAYSACDDHLLSSPVIRVDLTSRLTATGQLKPGMFERGTWLECQKHFLLSAPDAQQSFYAIWRVLEHQGSKLITALEVQPDGPTVGARAPEASALVEELKFLHQKKSVISVLPLRVIWSATQGCRKITVSTSLQLHANDISCKGIQQQQLPGAPPSPSPSP